MHMPWVGWSGLIGTVAFGLALQAAELTPQVEPLRVTLTLSDGSKLIGQPALATLPLQTEYSRMEIPFAKISTLKFAAGATNVTAVLVNGDKLSAVPGIAELRLTTLFGKVAIPLTLVTGLAVSAGGTATAARDGLILWFPFDGVTGPDVTDASDHGHTGKLFSGARIVADEGRRRDVLELDGGGAHIRVPGSADFCLTNVTLTVWLKPQQWKVSEVAQVILCTLTPRNTDGGFEAYMADDSILVWECRFPRRHAPLTWQTALGELQPETWHFVAITCDYQNGKYVLRSYLDGKLIQQDESVRDVMAYNGQEVHIGANYDSAAAGLGQMSGRIFTGRMDDLMLYNRALSAEEIAALYNAQK